MKRHQYRKGFTLIELLVVIVIIGILLGLLSTSLRRARENAKRRQGMVEAQTLAAAMRAYRHEYGKWPCSQESGVYDVSDDNATILEYLTDTEDDDHNPRAVHFINLGEYDRDEDGNVVDPWGNPHRMRIDLNHDSASNIWVDPVSGATNAWGS